MKTSKKKEDLIAKLLAKAEKTTAQEAEALTEAAEKLMLKYAIDQAMIDAVKTTQNQQKEKMIKAKHFASGVYRHAKRVQAQKVVHAFGQLRMCYQEYETEVISTIFGFETEIKQILTLIASLEIQAAVAMRGFWSANKNAYSHVSQYRKFKARESFLFGFGAGAAERIKANKYQIIQESVSGTEIALRDRDALVDEEFLNMFPNLVDGKTPSFYSSNAYSEGFADGQKANTGENEMTPNVRALCDTNL